MFRRKVLSMVLLVGLLMGQSVPHAFAATTCDQAQFVSDITVPDGSSFAPGAAFTKTWRFTNAGTCSWTTSYKVVFTGGDAMGTTLSVNLPVNVSPGQMLDLSVNLTAPGAPGHYRSFWKFVNESGAQFGIGDNADQAFWADINVVATDAVIYDFVANAPYAQWRSGAGPIPYPGTSGDRRGFAYQVNQPHLEDDSFATLPGLLTVPQNKYNGYIQATFPEFQVQAGDKLQTLVNCEFGATGCYVTFRIDYLLPNGAQRKLWQWREAYDNRFYRAEIDLSPLAGQKVRFVFMLLSSGFASKDRAIWGSPRIVREGAVQPPAPPPTLTPLPPLTPTQTPVTPPPPTVAASNCDRAAFITDVNVPDGTIFAPGAAFSKTWRLKNISYCTWTKDYKLMYYSGEQMGAPTAINIPYNVYYGQTIDLTVNMVAPDVAGEYRGFWILTNASDNLFGIGSSGTDPFWVEIKVAGESARTNGYDFWQNACSAEWKSGAGPLPCPGTVGDSKGYVIADSFSHLEDGTMGPAPSLLMAPQYKYNGYIQGFYPTFTVQPGDHFRSVVGCDYGTSCYVTFRLDYMNPNGYIGTFWQWREQYDNKNYTMDVDLSPLAGRSVRFILTILASGSANGDRIRWGAPRIFREGANIPPSSTPTSTSTPTPPSTSDWLTYTNSTYGFEFKYPPQSVITNQQTNFVHISLPIQPGTNLGEKYLETTVTEDASSCQSTLPQPPSGTTETVDINGISFLKQTGADAGVGNFYDWVAYSTYKGSNCVSMVFLLHSLNPGNFATPIPEFDKTAESAVFLQIMQTLKWIDIPEPPTPTFTPTPISIPGVLVPSPVIFKLYMLDASNGWAIGDNYLLRTTDGGNSWYNVLPGVSVSGSYFSSSTTGWVLTNSATMYQTTDGGASWTNSSVPFSNGHVQFLDNNNGYVMSILGAATSKQSVGLYQTTDGGNMWTLKFTNDPGFPGATDSLPLGGHKNGMTFRNINDGWVGGDYPTDGYFYLYRTTDGGVTWSRNQLPLPSGYETAYITTTAPKFFTSNDGVLPVWMTIGIGMRDLYLYTTHDGGNTWTPSAGFARNAEATDLVSLLNAFSWDWANVFHVTNDAGATWQTVTPNVNFGDNFHDMDFVSSTTGWLILNPVNGVTPLYRTSDGGATWTLLSGPQTTPPTPTPTTERLSHNAFCADPRVPLLLDQIKAGTNQSNGSLFSSFVSTDYGMDVRLWAYHQPVNFSASDVTNIFSNTTIYNWGAGPSGMEDMGSFKDVIQPKLLDVFNAPNMETYCDSLDKVYPLANPWPYPDVRFYNLYKPATPGIELDFRTWLIGFVYKNGEPYIHSMVNIVWEP